MCITSRGHDGLSARPLDMHKRIRACAHLCYNHTLFAPSIPLSGIPNTCKMSPSVLTAPLKQERLDGRTAYGAHPSEACVHSLIEGIALRSQGGLNISSSKDHTRLRACGAVELVFMWRRHIMRMMRTPPLSPAIRNYTLRLSDVYGMSLIAIADNDVGGQVLATLSLCIPLAPHGSSGALGLLHAKVRPPIG